MLMLRKANERGQADHGWLKSFHTFSFADFYDPKNMGFRVLRVINEDRIEGGTGFPTHGHRDMEIISYVIQGGLRHEDTLGNRTVIRPGELQRMSAGAGIRHSEVNDNKDRLTHFLQIWILTEKDGAVPSYDQKSFESELAKGRLILIGSRTGEQGSVVIHQDVKLFAGHFQSQTTEMVALAQGRHAWVQMIKGEAEVNGQRLTAGDGLAASNENSLNVKAQANSELLVFDLP